MGLEGFTNLQIPLPYVIISISTSVMANTRWVYEEEGSFMGPFLFFLVL